MKYLALPVFLVLAGCATGGKASDDGTADLLSMLAGQAPNKLSAEQQQRIAQHPLGSKENPVRVEGVRGEYQYLARLRCPENKPPVVERLGSASDMSPYGSIMDIYKVTCDSPPVREVFVDMYHAGNVETAAVPGFTIVAP